MRKFLITSLLAGLAFALPLVATSPAQASLADCGNINVSAQAQCTVVAPGVDCEAQCTPLNVKASCYAKLSASCSGQCDLPSVDCQASCNTSCKASCTPGSFSCSGNCSASCEGDCTSQCASSSNSTQCNADCKGKCSAQCSASCSGSPVDCEAGCSGSCQGSCTVKTSMECNLKCQASAEADCEVTMTGGCKGRCTTTSEGAAFCDGQYVDVGDNFKDCLDAISAIVKVEGYASAECSGNTCTAEAGASCGGHIVPVAHNEWALALGLGGALGAFGMMRRRRNRK
jgi:hypothetical protein